MFPDVYADRSLVRVDPVFAHIWVRDGAILSRLSVWIEPLSWPFCVFVSVRTRMDAGYLFASVRWRCPIACILNQTQYFQNIFSSFNFFVYYPYICIYTYTNKFRLLLVF
jgi:hypothetical protein